MKILILRLAEGISHYYEEGVKWSLSKHTKPTALSTALFFLFSKNLTQCTIDTKYHFMNCHFDFFAGENVLSSWQRVMRPLK